MFRPPSFLASAGVKATSCPSTFKSSLSQGSYGKSYNHQGVAQSSELCRAFHGGPPISESSSSPLSTKRPQRTQPNTSIAHYIPMRQFFFQAHLMHRLMYFPCPAPFPTPPPLPIYITPLRPSSIHQNHLSIQPQKPLATSLSPLLHPNRGSGYLRLPNIPPLRLPPPPPNPSLPLPSHHPSPPSHLPEPLLPHRHHLHLPHSYPLHIYL